MPINIREIFYPNDTDTIKWEKVNYNFDQILANGGKEGPKGTKGDTGLIGNTGTKGEKGDKGDEGVKGEQGSTNNFWDQFTHDTISGYVLKPKDGTNSAETIVYIGDNSYTEGTAPGDLAPNAQLTVGQSSSVSYAQKWEPFGTGLYDLTIRGEATSDYDGNGAAGTNWIVQPESVSNNVKLNLQSHVIAIGAYEKLDISSATGINFLSGGDVTFNTNSVNNNLVTYNSAVDFNDDVTVAGELSVAGENSEFTGTGSLKVNSGTTAQRPNPNVGMVRYNSTTSKFEGYEGSSWVDLSRLSNGTKTTYVSVQSDNAYYPLSEDNKVNLVASGIKTVSVSSSVVNIIKDTKLTTSDLYFLTKNRGVVFPVGSNSSGTAGSNGETGFTAGNFGSDIVDRTLRDYFEKGDYTPTNPLVKVTDSSSNALVIASSNYTDGDFDVNYTKIGNLINVFGQYEFKTTSFGGSYTLSDNFGLKLGVTDQFAYTNNSNFDIIVNVEVDNFQILNETAPTSAGNEPSDPENTPASYFGIIRPGENTIRLYVRRNTTASTGTGSTPTSPTNGAVVTIAEPVKLKHVVTYNTGSGQVPLSIRFSFAMPVNYESYTSFTTGGGVITGA